MLLCLKMNIVIQLLPEIIISQATEDSEAVVISQGKYDTRLTGTTDYGVLTVELSDSDPRMFTIKNHMILDSNVAFEELLGQIDNYQNLRAEASKPTDPFLILEAKNESVDLMTHLPQAIAQGIAT